MIIDGPLWFAGALIICGAHTLCLLGWRRERREQLSEWKKYDEASERRHVEFMNALSWYRRVQLGWSERSGKA